jgi:hypothetical protein
MLKINFRILPASRESISHVQTGAARKPNLCAICVRRWSSRIVRAGATFAAGKIVEQPDEYPQPEAA